MMRIRSRLTSSMTLNGCDLWWNLILVVVVMFVEKVGGRPNFVGSQFLAFLRIINLRNRKWAHFSCIQTRRGRNRSEMRHKRCNQMLTRGIGRRPFTLWLWFSIHEVKRGGFGGEKGWNWNDGRVHCGTWNDQLDVDADDVIFVELVALVIFVIISQCVRIFFGTTFRLFVPKSRRWVPSDVRAADCMLTSAFWCFISYRAYCSGNWLLIALFQSS